MITKDGMDLSDPATLERLAKCFNSFSGFVGWKDTTSHYLFANQAAANMCGFKSYEDYLINRVTESDYRCQVADLAETFHDEDRKIIESKRPQRFLEYLCFADNEWRSLIGEKNPIFDAKGQVIALALIFTDITNTTFANKSFDKLVLSHGTQPNAKQYSFTIECSNEPMFNLTPRQLECLYYLLHGASAKATAERLGISPRTVEVHLETLKRKFQCAGKYELIEKAVSLNYTQIIPESILSESK
ncbi:MAG: helix-turn-helix transcriptional regulator [Gammaproteobacteria bacterium]|nr:helix-turn-helix transcriptional regulator [Gammaproteobacteria bacterium]